MTLLTTIYYYLLDKLHHLGFRGIIHSWLSSCLSNRLQYAEMNAFKSDYQQIICSVPQEFILGPLIFLLYIIDIIYISKQLKFTLFADDATIFFTDPSLKYFVTAAKQFVVSI